MKTFLVLIFSFFTKYAFSQALDESFGNHGVLVDKRIQESSNSLAIQKDGKIILGGGNFLLTRYNPDGTADEAFGSEGVVNNLVLNGAICNDILLQGDGKILATGSIPNRTSTNRADAIVVRFKSNGQLDSSFGANGIVLSDIQQEDNANKIILQSDGRIVITGTADNEGGESQKPGGLFVNQYMPDGTKDENFGNNGSIFLTKSLVYEVNGLAVDINRNIYIAYDSAAGTLSYILLKLDDKGSLVSSFGSKGQAEILIPGTGSGSLKNIKVHDGFILATGYSLYKGKGIRNLTLVKYTAEGYADAAFGNNGIKILEMGYNWTEGNEIGITSNNNIVVAGRFVEAYPSTKYYATLYGFSSSGNIDSTFGTNGSEVNYNAGEHSLFEKLFIDHNGVFTASGGSYFSETNTTNYMVSKYLSTNNIKNPIYVRIKKWLHHHGFTWEDRLNRNLNYYSIQRSNNGNPFVEISKIFGSNASHLQTFEDFNVPSGTNSYRVGIVNNSENISYSNTLIISKSNEDEKVIIYPNPAKYSLQIEGLSASANNKLSIVDINGNVRKTASTVNTSFSYNLSQLPIGNYALIISNGKTVISKRFIKE